MGGVWGGQVVFEAGGGGEVDAGSVGGCAAGRGVSFGLDDGVVGGLVWVCVVERSGSLVGRQKAVRVMEGFDGVRNVWAGVVL